MTNLKFQKKLKLARNQIDKIDKKIIANLAARMTISQKIGRLKKSHKMPVVQPTRWNILMRDRFKQAKKSKMSVTFVKQIFDIIQAESINVQKKANIK